MGGCVGKEEDHPVCYLDIGVEDKDVGRLYVELRPDIAPRTVENFRQLCTGEAGNWYKGTGINRVIPGFMAQGGECGSNIYGKKFEDETFELKHDARGVVSMANNGPHTNNSQFFVVLQPSPQLDGLHVAFGKVIKGFSVLDVIEPLGSPQGHTSKNVTITGCGLVVAKDERKVARKEGKVELAECLKLQKKKDLAIGKAPAKA